MLPSVRFNNLEPGTVISVGEVLFKKLEKVIECPFESIIRQDVSFLTFVIVITDCCSQLHLALHPIFVYTHAGGRKREDSVSL